MELDPRFKIRAPLRCEGIGRLDCAEDLESGMRMAVRWLPLEANGSAAVQACEQLPEHPTLPRIRQIGQMGASAYVAMDFPDGNLLATQLHEVQSAASLIGITAQIADALATIHMQDVVHGEMSADSILIVSGPSEKAYLWDMPLVIANRVTDRRGEDRLMHQLVKTAAFLSPERARGSAPTPEGDVYALGAIVCIAGGAPLPPGQNTLAVIHSVAVGTWVPKVPKSLPEPLRSMLERMIARDAFARPTAREVAELFMPPVAAHRTEPELPAIVLPAAVPVEAQSALQPATDPVLPKVESAVQLTDNISVSQDLADAGAALLSPDEAAFLIRSNRKVPLRIAAAMAVLVVGLSALAVNLSHRKGGTEASPTGTQLAVPTRTTVTVTALAPLDFEASSDDELFSLTPRVKKVAAKKRAPKAEVAAQDSDFVPGMTGDPALKGEFGFLEEEPELKRPTF